MRALSVAKIFVAGYILSAVAQNSNPPLELDSPTMQVAPSPEAPEPDNPAAKVAPNLENLSPETDNLDNQALQTLKSLAPELENPSARDLEHTPTQSIPYLSAPTTPKTPPRH